MGMVLLDHFHRFFYNIINTLKLFLKAFKNILLAETSWE